MTPEFDPMGHETPGEDQFALSMLSRGLLKMNNFKACIEVGAWAGGTTLTLLPYFDRIFCIDTWEGTPSDRTWDLKQAAGGADAVFRTFCRNVARDLNSRIFPCRGPSLLWASIWPYEVDLIFIDADHSYEAVKADILAWRPHLRKGGILCGHDYNIFEGVTRAVDELIPGRLLGGRCLWYTRLD